ncbi:MAG: hypothetical protein CSA26_03705 [Desulfobacterales bacterium]|nr:MAG: hypothetical protein CSA26_03705 [Desulfobacterales bacterium]
MVCNDSVTDEADVAGNRFNTIVSLSIWLLFLIVGAVVMVFWAVKLTADKPGVLMVSLGVIIVLLSVFSMIWLLFSLFVPRIKEITAVLGKVTSGDFDVRVARVSSSFSTVDAFVDQVNLLIGTIREYVEKLHELNSAGEELADALTRDEVVRVAVETVEEQLKTRCLGVYTWEAFEREMEVAEFSGLLSQKMKGVLLQGRIVVEQERFEDESGQPASSREYLFVPFIEHNDMTNIMVFSGGKEVSLNNYLVSGLVGTLVRLVNDAFLRIQSIHDLAGAERKYRALFVMMQDGIFRVADGGGFEDLNPAFASMCGYDSVGEMTERVVNINDMFADPEERDLLYEVLEQDGFVKGMGMGLFRRDGSSFPVLLSAHVVRGEHGEVTAIEANVVDMTERTLREKAEREQAAAEAVSRAKSEMLDDLETKNQQLGETLEEMRIMQQQLLQSEKMAMVGSMAAGIAHDLSNILAESISYSDLMLVRLPVDSDLREPLVAIRNAGIQSIDIIDDLLLLSQDEMKRLETRELNVFVQDCLNTLDVIRLCELNPELVFNSTLYPDQVYLRCMPLLLQKAIVNLVVGGMEIVGENGRLDVVVDVASASHDDLNQLGLPEDSYAVLRIFFDDPRRLEDNERIFEPFYFSSIWGDYSAKRGLGLAVSRNLVQKHGGTVIAENAGDGRGAFTVYLPITKKAEISDDEVTQGVSDLQGKGSVLVVDDEPLQRDIAGKMLAKLGYEVYLAASGGAAVDFVKNWPVDLILLDMLMPPGINGRETYEQIRKISSGQKVLLVSGFGDSKDIQETLQRGAAGLLRKPYSLVQLGQAVKAELAFSDGVRD